MPAGVMKGHARTAPASPVRDPLRRAIARFERERARKREQQDEASSPTATAAAASSSSSASASNSFTTASEPVPLHKSIAEQEEQRGIIELHVCWNDLAPEQDRQKVRWLFDTQQLFSVQLPKMPREYVTRLVFDRNHRHLLVNKHGKGIIAGICYRPFPEQGFAEIVFCAVTADEQVKGYGTLMMNHLKDYMVGQQRIFHLLTYADEFAIGYFAKQDFVTQIALPEECYKGFIKEYQGATPMYCQLHPKMIYVRAKQIYQDAKQLYMMALRERFPNFGREFEGLEPLFKLNEGRPLRAEQVPGLETLHNFAELRSQDLQPQADAQQAMRTVLQKVRADKNAWPFLDAVDPDDVPDYYTYIPFPIDLGTIGDRMKAGYYTHERMFLADFRRMFDNCYKFNGPDSQYYFHAYRLNEVFNRLARAHFPHAQLQARLPDARPEYSPPSTEGSGRRK